MLLYTIFIDRCNTYVYVHLEEMICNLAGKKCMCIIMK